MKKLLLVISLISSLGVISSDYITEYTEDVTEVLQEIEADDSFSIKEKEAAFDYVSEHLEDVYNKLKNGENVYSTPAYLGGRKWIF